MQWMTRLLVGVLAITAVPALGFADDADTVRVHLDNAKTINTKAHQQAADALKVACETAIKSAADQAAQIKAQEQAFAVNGTLPTSPAVKQAVADYRGAIELADANLDRAYSRAVRKYATQGHGDLALAVEQEKTRLIQQRSPVTEPAGKSDSTAPDAIAQTLSKAKAQYRTDANDAMKTLVGKVDARLKAVTDAGELQPAQVMKATADDLKNHGVIPDVSTDPAVSAAVTIYHHAIQTANVKMARAFSAAVHNLTRARELDQAQAVQTEFITTELSDIDLTATDNGNAPADTTYVLGRTLPEFFTTAEHWDMHPRGGIFLQRRTFIRSKNGDFLNRDFTCDIWFTTETTGTTLFIGLGEGRGRPAESLPSNSLALCIGSPDFDSGSVGFLRPDGQVDSIGTLSTAGDYVARLQRVGNVLSMSVGDEDADGTFNPKFSTTFSDTTVMAPFITNHNAHIFFGGGRFWKVRYINGKPPAFVPDVVVKSLMN